MYAFTLDHHRGYNKEDDWSDLEGECDGEFQSPIDLIDFCDDKNRNKSVILDKSLSIVLINYDEDLGEKELLMKNNGHTLQISIKGGDSLDNALPQLSGSAVGFNKFQLQQIHVHWNRNGSHSGSEHSLYGSKKAFEMHFVHFNTKYDAPDDASDHPDGSAVLSVLFDYYDCEEDGDSKEKCAENTPENMALAPITTKLRAVDDAEESTTLDQPLNLKKLLPRDTETFYWYQGSLTTPPCAEDLTWIVFTEIQNISKRQLTSFEHSFKNEDGKVLGTTNRAIQPLNGRLLLISRDDHCDGKDAVPKGSESDSFADSTNISIGAQQTVAEVRDEDEDDDKDDEDDDGRDSSSSSSSKDGDSNQNESNSNSNSKKNDEDDDDDDKNNSSNSSDSNSKDNDDDKGSGSKNDDHKSKDSGNNNNSSSSSSEDSKSSNEESSNSSDSNKSKGKDKNSEKKDDKTKDSKDSESDDGKTNKSSRSRREESDSQSGNSGSLFQVSAGMK